MGGKISVYNRFLKASGVFAVLLLLGLCMGETVAAKGTARDKARHFYLKGAVKEAEGKSDEAHEFFKKAYLTDPRYLEAAYNYIIGRIEIAEATFSEPDSVEVAENLDIMRRIVDKYPSDVEYAENYAYYLVQLGSFEDAKNVYRNISSHRPALSRLYLPQAYLYGVTEQPDSALKAIREFERFEGISSETTMRKAGYHLAMADTVGALDEFRLYADSSPGDIGALMDLTMAYNLLGQPDTAYSIIREAAQKYPDNTALQFEYAMVAKDAGDVEQFSKSVREALTTDDLDDDIRLGMLAQFVESLSEIEGWDYKESDAIMLETEKIFGDDNDFLDIYSRYGVSKGDMPLAYDKVRLVYLKDTSNPAWLAKLMSFAILADRPEDAIKAFDDYEGEEKNEIFLAFPYISALELTGDYDKALAQTDVLLKSYIPSLSITDSEVDPVILAEESSLNLEMASAIFEITSEIYQKTDSVSDVLRCFEMAMKLGQENTSLLNNYAYYLVENAGVKPGSEEFEKAKEMSRKSLTDSEAPYYYYDTYAWILFKEGDFKDALEYQEIAMEKADDELSSEILDHYGDILFMNGRVDDAVAQWEKALELEPDNESIKKKVESKTIGVSDPGSKK